MVETPALQRIVGGWRRRVRGVAPVALSASLLVVGLAAAHVARLGTVEARAVAAGAVALVAVVFAVTRYRAWRGLRDARWIVRHLLHRADARVADKAGRALTLVERTSRDDGAGSAELARIHLERVLARVPPDAVDAAAKRHAARWQVLGVVAILGAMAGVAVEPMRAIEGGLVLAARDGVAPAPLEYLGFVRVRALPPRYTGHAERSLVFGASVALPKGTAVTVRGVPRHAGRKLVLTDGTDEVPFLDDGAGGLVARLTVRRDGNLKIAARLGDVLVQEPESLFVHALPDQTPVIVLDDAPRTVELSRGDDIELRWAAEDDYALRQVDLVLRSGAREDRRVLGHFEGQARSERGAHTLLARDEFLTRMFLPIRLSVQAKDNDPFDGSKWGVSEVITILPPAVGEPEAQRFRALRGLKDDLVELYARARTEAEAAGVGGAAPETPDERNARQVRTRELRAAYVTYFEGARRRLDANFAGLSVPRGVRSFAEGQLQELERAIGADAALEPTEDAILALDVALESLATRDAQEVAKRLGDVAEEIATGARLAREMEDRRSGVARIDEAVGALAVGAGHLVELGALGRDVGAVARSGTGRITRARQDDDLMHVELAALHLAERLRRPNPSFGAKGGRGGGVESGGGHPSGSPSPEDVPPSDADKRFDALAQELERLAQEHGEQAGRVERALESARDEEQLESMRAEAARRARELREAVDELPRPGMPPRSRAALEAIAREHAAAAAHGLERMNLGDALESAKNAQSNLRESRRRPGAGGVSEAQLDVIERQLSEQIEWIRESIERLAEDAERRARERLSEIAEGERDMAERADRISEAGRGEEASLPEDVTRRLSRAEGVMREAARALSEGRGREALELQREAQRLLEQSETGRTGESEGRHRSQRKDEDGRGPPHGGRDLAEGSEVPEQDDRVRAEEFRKRVLRGLAEDKSERLGPSVRRYAEGLLR